MTLTACFDILREMHGDTRITSVESTARARHERGTGAGPRESRRWVLRVAPALVALLTTIVAAHAVPFWGDKQSLPPETDPATLKPGQFVWEGDAAASSR